MKRASLKALWDKYSDDWLNNETISVNNEAVPVKEICSIKKDYDIILLKRYNRMKAVVKDTYFGTDVKHVNRYKRAAILAYVISSAEPLEYKVATTYGIDDYFLKQRLAVQVALGSIVVDFPESKVSQLPDPLFEFYDLGFLNDKGFSGPKAPTQQDDFLQSLYKDLFFAEIHQNYNVLTMANVFGLLTEKCSKLALLR